MEPRLNSWQRLIENFSDFIKLHLFLKSQRQDLAIDYWQCFCCGGHSLRSLACQHDREGVSGRTAPSLIGRKFLLFERLKPPGAPIIDRQIVGNRKQPRCELALIFSITRSQVC